MNNPITKTHGQRRSMYKKNHVQGNNSVGISAGKEEGYIRRAEIQVEC